NLEDRSRYRRRHGRVLVVRAAARFRHRRCRALGHPGRAGAGGHGQPNVARPLMTAEAAATPNRVETIHSTATAQAPAVAWRDMRVTYSPRARGTEPVVAVDGVSLAVPQGGTVGIAGESGCGKSTLALSALRLLPRTARVDGAIEIAGEDVATMRWG